jgi:hypothetical protein
MVDSFVMAPAREAPAIRVGDVLNRSLGLFGASWIPFVALSLIAFAPEFLLRWLITEPRSAGVVGGVVRLVCTSLADATIIYGVVQMLRGRGFTIADSLNAGLARISAVIGVSLVVGILVGLGAILLIVPGVIVWCMYAVAIPVCVAERTGIGASLTRSAFLTKGNRWRILGLFAVVFVVTLLIGAILGGLGVALGGVLFGTIVIYLLESALGAYSAVMVGVLYHQLRVAREGVDIEYIAAVFE